MAVNNYEKYVGYSYNELNYKKEIVIDDVTGNEVEKLIKRTPEEIEAYKQQKELEFKDMIATWERLGVKKCAWEREFDAKGFNKICLNLIENRFEELKNVNPQVDIESRMLNALEDVDKKYNLTVALNFYSVNSYGRLGLDKLFNGMSKSQMENMFYRNISIDTANELARDRLEKATTLKEGIAAVQEFQKTHDKRSIFFKIFHPFKNANENRFINEVKAELMQKFNISSTQLENKLRTEIDRSTLKSADLYKIDNFVKYYCAENAGRIYSQNKIDLDRQDVSRRAEDDFIESQMELDRVLKEDVRESIIVDDAKDKDEMERSAESIVEDPKIIKVPNNNNK